MNSLLLKDTIKASNGVKLKKTKYNIIKEKQDLMQNYKPISSYNLNIINVHYVYVNMYFLSTPTTQNPSPSMGQS